MRKSPGKFRQAPRQVRVKKPLQLALAPLTLAAGLGMAVLAQADEARRVEGLRFDELLVVGSVSVEVRQGEITELQIRGPKDSLDPDPFLIKGETLVLGARRSRENRDYDKLRFRVEVPILRELEVRGSGDVYVKPFDLAGEGALSFSIDGSGDIKLYGIIADKLELRIEGPGDIKAMDVNVGELKATVAGSGDLYIKTLRADDAEFVVTGSGDIKVTDSGSVGVAEVNVIGSGDASLDAVGCELAEVNIVGSGSAAIGAVSTRLNASIIGSGDVSYRGEPEVDSVQFGSGAVRRRN